MNTNTLIANVPSLEEFKLASRHVNDHVYETELGIAELNCGACISKIEKQLRSLDAVCQVRANLTKKRVCVQWYKDQSATDILASLRDMGFTATLINSSDEQQSSPIKPYLRALAVAGFAASNIMLMSVAVWSGADTNTQQLFHWVSAAIAIPAIVYSGSVFFKSAWLAVRNGRTNMDVPISVGIVLSVLLGLYDTINQHDRVYFEAATMLVFFLLIGRTLDLQMRTRAASTVDGLKALEPPGAFVLNELGKPDYKAINEVIPGDIFIVKPGHRTPVDGTIVSGNSTINTAIVDGESQAKLCRKGQLIYGGSLNIDAELTIKATANRDQSFLAQMHKLVQFAQSSKSGYTQIADKAAQWYAPVVHTAALIAFGLWIYLTGDIHRSLTVAISVLIITCPCALALAVPMVHVIGGNQLLKRGIIMKGGGSLERLAEIGTIVFDKTGTLTDEARIVNSSAQYTDDQLKLAASIAHSSMHPHAKAIMQIANQSGIYTPKLTSEVIETPGCGLETTINNKVIRLGKREWAAYSEYSHKNVDNKAGSETVLTSNGRIVTTFSFIDELRLDASVAIQRLRERAFNLALVSGDKPEAVTKVAKRLDLVDAHGSMMPADKVSFIQHLSKSSPAMMVGDGINDSGAMAAAHVAMAPGTAASVGRNLADFIFMADSLQAVPDALEIAYKAKLLVKQNISLAVLYNMAVLPVAFLGLVTPLIAAIAMSLSSILVVANAMRLNGYSAKKHGLSGKGRSLAFNQSVKPA